MASEERIVTYYANAEETVNLSLQNPPQYALLIKELTAGDETFNKDMTLPDPLKLKDEATDSYVGFMTYYQVNLVVGGLYNFLGRFSLDNLEKLDTVRNSTKQKKEIKIYTLCCKYDPRTNEYYECLDFKEQLTANIAEEHGINIDDRQQKDVTTIPNWEAGFGFIGSGDDEQNVHYASGPLARIVCGFTRKKGS